MKTFFKFSGVLFILLFQFMSCADLNNGRPILFYYDEPVAVYQVGDNPLIRNESYIFNVPELKDNTSLKPGDLLWTSFIVDLENEKEYYTSSKKLTAINFRYETVDSAKIIIPSNIEEFRTFLSDDYSAPIELSFLYLYEIDNLWFFGFKQRDHSNHLSHTYEMILNPELENDGHPTLYIRSKQLNISAESNKKARSNEGNIFAFDATGFVEYYRKTISSTGPVRFNLKYKTNVDANGDDIYRSFMSNPISWNFSYKKPL